MTDHIHEQVSQFVDDEMSAEECDFFVRRLERDTDARQRFLRYQLIGAAMRGERVPGGAGTVSRASAAPSSRLARFGVAASLVLAALVGLVSGDSMLSDQDPVADARRSGLQTDVMGVQYLIHHTGMSSGLNRTLMHSSVFSGIDTETGDEEVNEPLD